jgi:hypothetical protein
MKASDARIGDVRAAVVNWTGTEDAVSADPISVWGAAGTVPTYIAGYANANTPANLSPTTSWATYKIEGVSISASATNLAVFVWIDDKTTTAGDYLLVTDVQLEKGAICTDVERRHIAVELTLCSGTARWRRLGDGEVFAFGLSTTTSQVRGHLPFLVRKRAVPTISFSSGTDFQVLSPPPSSTGTSMSSTADGVDGTNLVANTAGGAVAAGLPFLIISKNTSARVIVAERSCDVVEGVVTVT